MSKAKHSQAEQSALDTEDNCQRLAQITAALDVVERKRNLVISLKNQLAQAKRALEEAEWEANAKIRQIAGRLRPARPHESGNANGKR